jgi:hypothetical protein
VTDQNDVAVAAINAGGNTVTTLGSKWLDLAEWRKVVATLLVLGAVAGLVCIFAGYERRAVVWDALFRDLGTPVLDHQMAGREVAAFHSTVTTRGAEAAVVVQINRRTHRRSIIAWAADDGSHADIERIARSEVDVPLDEPGVYTTPKLRLFSGRPYWIAAVGRDRWDRLIVPIPPRYSEAGDVVGMLVVLVERSAPARDREAIETLATRWATRLAR